MFSDRVEPARARSAFQRRAEANADPETVSKQVPSSGGALSAIALGGADLAVAQAEAAAAGQPLSIEQQSAFMREKVEQRGAEVQHRLVSQG